MPVSPTVGCGSIHEQAACRRKIMEPHCAVGETGNLALPRVLNAEECDGACYCWNGVKVGHKGLRSGIGILLQGNLNFCVTNQSLTHIIFKNIKLELFKYICFPNTECRCKVNMLHLR